MDSITEDNPLRSPSSIAVRLASLVRDTARRVRDRRSLEETLRPLLVAARELAGGDRAFLLARATAASRRPTVLASLPDDGVRGRRSDRPSRTIAMRALASTRAAAIFDIGDELRPTDGASVRALRLRAALYAPVACVDGRSRSLLVDSRRVPLATEDDRLRPLESLAALAALTIDAVGARGPDARDGARTHDASPSDTSLEVGFDDTPGLERWIRSVAATSLPVLITGESGSGKERVAMAIHHASARRAGVILAVNCAAMHESLLDAELFGARRGAYTGAESDRTGLLRAADGGTILLDEIGDMPAAMQARLLRALQEQRVRPLGDSAEYPIDVRVLAATHRDLRRLVGEERFREDLYFRIATLQVHVPPLRERPAALPALVSALGPRLSSETGWGPPRLTGAAWGSLRGHDWPGNVRELHAVLARATLRAAGGPIEPRHLDLPPSVDGDDGMEAAMIRRALALAEGSIGRAAALIGWTRQKLYRRMRGLGVGRPALQPSPAGRHSSASSTFQ